MTKRTGPTNPITRKLVAEMASLSNKEKVKLWKDVASRLQKPTRIRAAVNVSHIQKHLREGETAIVPGKLLGTGLLEKPIKVAALDASASAKAKIKAAKGEYFTIQELMKKNPKASRVRIMQ